MRLSIIIILVIFVISSYGKRKAINVDKLEKEWENGDDLEDEFTKKIKDKRKMKETPPMDFNDMDKVKQYLNNEKIMNKKGKGHYKDGSMMFVELDVTHPNVINKKKSGELASMYTDMMHNANIAAQIYSISDEKFLFKVDKSMHVYDTIKFAATRPEVKMVTLDNKEYTAKDFQDDEL